MRNMIYCTLCVTGIFALSACERQGAADVNKAPSALNVIDESNLNDIMLSAADPNEAVAYVQKSSADNPERIDLKRGLASALVRAGRASESLPVWKAIIQHSDSENSDLVDYADALIRANNWPEAEKVLDSVPPTFESFKRYRLEAMIADGNEEWTKSDSFYEIAVGLTTQPSGVLNNWGYSKLTRGDYREAEKLFGEALKYDGSLFTAKNNLVLARGAQRKYDLPIVPMTQTERAQLMHTLALAAIKQGDVVTGRGLLQQAIETHPQHFEAAVRSLEALDANVTN